VVNLPRSRAWATVLVGEVLEEVFASHRGEPEHEVQAALLREYDARGIGDVPPTSDMVTTPAALIAEGVQPAVDERWLDGA